MDRGESSNIFTKSSSCSLLSALNFNPWLFRPPDGDWELQFVVYQLFRLYRELSNNEQFKVSSLNLRNLQMSESLWISVAEKSHSLLFDTLTPSKANVNVSNKVDIAGLFSPPSYDIISHLTDRTFQSVCTDWLFNRVSNFEYILYLNYMAGRNWNDPNYYPIMPWVTDFSVENGGFVNLSKTKFRQTKGDAALDSTFMLISSGTTPPHHIPSLLTDLTFYLYKARRLEKELLCRYVRKRWVPSEYPSSMKRMQEWSPEECIPDFYCDPVIFKSIHEDLPDIAYPNWCNSPEDFIRYNRSILESGPVSANLHSWIDLTFGYQLSGAAAISEKNVHLYLVDTTGKVSHRSGIVQLFTSPHPPRFESVAGQRADFLKQSPVAILDFTEKFADFLAETAPGSAIDDVFDKYLRSFLESPWDFSETKQLLTAVAVLIVEISLYHSSGAEIGAANCIPESEKCFQSRLQLATNLYKLNRENFDKMLTTFKPYLDDVLLGNSASEEDSRLDLHRLDPVSSIGAVLLEGIYFPSYFPAIYDCLVDVHSLRNSGALPVEIIKTVMAFMSSQSDLPYAIAPSFYKLFSDLFAWNETQSLAIFCLLPSFGTLLGRENCTKFLLKPLTQVMQTVTDPAAVSHTHKQHCLKFFHRDFEMKLINLFGLQVFLDSVVPFVVRGTIFMAEGVEIGTLGWAIDFVGPIHAARCIIPIIFASLSSCYDDAPNSFNEQNSPCQECPFPSLHCAGDWKADRLGTVLCEAACTYGELLITGHYVSCIAEIIQQAFSSQGSLTEQIESSLIGVLYVLRQLIFIMSGSVLHSQIQERLSRLLTQVVTQITSLHVAFPRAPRSRHLALCRFLDVVYAIGLRLGRLNTEQLLEPLLRLTLIKLSVTYRASIGTSSSETEQEQGSDGDPEQRLPSESLHLAYSVFSRIVSRYFLESITSMNPPLPALQLHEFPDLCSSASRDRQLFSLANSFGSAGSNRLSQDSLKMSSLHSSFDLSGAGEVDQSFRLWERKSRHLANQWAALWAQRLAAPRDYSLRGLHLQTFNGQGPQTKGSVHHLVVSPANEQFAVSVSSGSGRDRAVAVWSLESRSDFALTPPVLLYPEHKRRCIGLTILDAHRQVLSVDATTLHLWDPGVGRPVSLITCPAAIASLPNSTYATSYSSPQWTAVSGLGDSGQLGLVSTGFGVVFVVDPRLPTTIATAFRAPPLPSGSTSLLTSNSDASLIAVGASSSYVSVLCPRTGRLVAATRVYDSDLAKLSFFDRNHLLTANHDRVLSLWSVNDALPTSLPLSSEASNNENLSSLLTLIGHFRASLSDSPVSIMPGPQLPFIVVATSDRLQYYSSGLDPRSICQDFAFSRLEQLRGKTVTAATVIPSSGFLLLGTEVGSLHLIA